MADTAIFDVDGTLVDTNYQHALAWYRAFRRHDITPAVWRIHRALGMGGDHLVTAIAGEDVEAEQGDALRAAWTEEFEPMLEEIQPFDGARDLIEDVASRGFRLVLASSGQKAHVEHFLDLIGGRDVADAWTTADDVDATKPDPDLVGVALEKVDGSSGVMIGDSVWDAVAAGKLDVPTIAVRTGGFSEEELRNAGAFRVYDSLRELRDNLDGGPLARVTR
ncbi:HAD family hydrolase [Microbacterium sp. SSW1-59]|uniref:HAD family hydrolase n=1 Tax=Microbacterium xanthum TaxID=3079794 RepID=UPI002AD25C54|nr:HAD family hydrolase [Microbacterium sp. SSW1-59]MDZ8202039.1 HAD family hydrolase [Microbacterium sp. SSW1-59]